MLKCLECSYSTNDKDKKFCPYDGSELVESDEGSIQSTMEEYNDEYNEDN